MPAPSTSNFDTDYFPVRLNNFLNVGRYQVLRKLGQGVSSSSWLVHSDKGEPGYKYLAVKILTIDATQRHDAGQSRELKFLQEIKECNDTDFLPMLRDDFVERGPKGEHLCLVQDLYSTSVSSLRRSSPYKALPPHMARNIVSMLVEALAQLHAMHIIHTGPCQTRQSPFWQLNPFDEDLQRYLESNPTEVEGQGQLSGDSYPIFKTQPIPNGYSWDTSAFEAEKMFIYLTDLGHAQRAGERPTADCFGALALRAPETILQSDFGSAVDVWAVGCITFELLVGRWLFHPEDGKNWNLEDDHLAKMMELTGQTFPTEMLGRAQRRNEYFDDADNLLRITELIPLSLEAAMKNYRIPNLSENEIKTASDFIRACLKFNYQERATAEDLRKHRFLEDAFKC